MSDSDRVIHLVSIRDAARNLGVSPNTLRRQLSAWGIPPIRLGRRVLIDLRDLVALVERQRATPR